MFILINIKKIILKLLYEEKKLQSYHIKLISLFFIYDFYFFFYIQDKTRKSIILKFKNFQIHLVIKKLSSSKEVIKEKEISFCYFKSLQDPENFVNLKKF